MASTREFVDFICEQSGLPNRITYKRMFGEYAVYLDEKVVAFVCDNQLFIKPTKTVRQILGKVLEAPPCPGAKLYFQVNEHLENRELLKELLQATAKALPPSKPKRKESAPIKRKATIKQVP